LPNSRPDAQLLFITVPLPRKFLNEDEELLVEMRPHWVFFARRLFTAALVVAAVIAILVAWSSIPNWLEDALMVLAAIPVLWFVGRLLRWRVYTLALTTTRILLRRGLLDRDIVQIRLQRITEINLSQKLWERVIATGRLIIDVQGEDDAVVLEFVRKPAIFQRVINGQMNELVGGGIAEPIPEALRNIDTRSSRSARGRRGRGGSEDTPPFGTPAVVAEGGPHPQAQPQAPSNTPPQAPMPTPAAPPPSAFPPPTGGTGPAEIRDRLIELDDLRQRRIISEEEFAAKKAELLSRL
jgi:membrane protein YdbS with pleckstrin-like domain